MTETGSNGRVGAVGADREDHDSVSSWLVRICEDEDDNFGYKTAMERDAAILPVTRIMNKFYASL